MLEVRLIRVKNSTWGKGVSKMAKKIPTSFMDGLFHGKMFTYRMKVTFSAFYGWMIASILLYIVTFLVDKIMVAREKMHTSNGGGAGRFSFPGQEHVAQGRRNWGCRGGRVW